MQRAEKPVLSGFASSGFGPRVVLGAAIAVFAGNALWYWPYVVDDAFISLRYAWNLVHGNGLVFNPGERVEGFSNFSWVMLEAALLWLGVPVVATWKVLGFACGVGVLVLTARLASLAVGCRTGVAWSGAIAALGLSFHAGFAAWSQAGLETVFFAMLLVASFVRYETEFAHRTSEGPGRSVLPLSAALFAIAWMTRPETPVYLLAFAIRRVAVVKQLKLDGGDLRFVAMLAVFVVPYELQGYATFGTWLPQTYSAKVGYLHQGSLNLGLLFDQPLLTSFAFDNGIGWTLLLASGTLVGMVVIARGRSLPVALLAPIAAGLVFAVWVRSDFMPRDRLLVPLLPFVFAALAVAARGVVHACRYDSSGTPRPSGLAAATLAGLLLAGFSGHYAYVQSTASYDDAPEHPGMRPILPRRARESWIFTPRGPLFAYELPVAPLAQWIVTNVPEGEEVVIRKIGLPGYLGMNPIFDTVGLVTPVAARARGAIGRPNTDVVLDALRERKPGAMILTRSDNLSALDARIDAWMRSDPQMTADYRAIDVPTGVQSWSVWLRRDLEPVDVEARLTAARERLPAIEHNRVRTRRGLDMPSDDARDTATRPTRERRTDLPEDGRWREARTVVQPVDEASRQQLEALGYAAGTRAPSGSGVTIHDPERAYDGYNFYTSAHDEAAFLIDMQGRVLHEWQHRFEDMPGAPRAVDEGLPNRWWRRAWLYENGDILALYTGMGLARLDRDSKLVWSSFLHAHHDVAFRDDDGFVVLTRDIHVLPRFHPTRPVVEDTVTYLDSRGRPERTFSILEAVEASPFANTALADIDKRIERFGDLLHTNSIEILDGRLADRHPAFAPGNLLVSFRHADAIGILDPERELLVWFHKGSFSRQHDPKILSDSRLMLFDNRKVDVGSRVLEIDPISGETLWSYAGDETSPFYSASCGIAERLPNGNRLVTESDNGRAFEVTPDGTIVWEFRSPHRAGDSGELVATLPEVLRLPKTFPLDWLPQGPPTEDR